MQTIDVRTGRPYRVLIGDGLLERTGELVSPLVKGRRALIVSDSNVMPLYGDRVAASLEAAGFDTATRTFPAGEDSKTPATLLALLDRLATLRLTRTDLIVALGGGVTGDMTGLAASLYLRGIACVQIPTSLLAMVDSSVGGKTAVNLEAGKNLMGAFFQPVLVLCDPTCLKTLPKAEMANGWAEIIKYAVLRDEPLLGMLEGDMTDDVLRDVIGTCVGIKRDIVEADEFEAGCRALLNLGHTIGHAVERVSDYAVPHGRAVGIGMAVMARGLVREGLAEPALVPRLEALLTRYGLTACCDDDPEALLEAARSDKKSAGDGITLILPEAFGRCRTERTTFDTLDRLMRRGLEPMTESDTCR